MARNTNGFDESAADAAAEEAARKKRERDRKAAAAAAANGKGNGANPVTTASFEYETDRETGELIPTSPSQPTYPGHVPPVVAYEPPEVVENTTDSEGEWDPESETYIPISDDAIDLLEETDTQPEYTAGYVPSKIRDEATTRTPMQVYLDLIEEGSFREGDIVDLGLPPDQASVLRQAISNKNQRERENLEKGRDAQRSVADSFADRDTEGPEIADETGKILEPVESTFSWRNSPPPAARKRPETIRVDPDWIMNPANILRIII